MTAPKHWNINIVNPDKIDLRFIAFEQLEAAARFEEENQLFSFVLNGDVEGMEAALQEMGNPSRSIRVGRMSKSSLRQNQYMAVAFVTLATRYAIMGGLQEIAAYRISDTFIQAIDKETKGSDVIRHISKMFLEFAHQVNSAKPALQYSIAVQKCLDYIRRNLHADIRLEQLASLCNLSCGYLSSRFKQEVGLSFSSYVSKMKLQASEEMLRNTSYTYNEIATLLNYCSQSYFIQCFKKAYGITPKEFRRRNSIFRQRG